MMTTEQTRVQFLTEALVEVLNNQWKVDAIESGHQCYYQTEIEEGRKYIKLITWLSTYGNRERGNSAYMFVDKKTGECYKPASWKSPAKGVRYLITQLADNPETCDPYGSFLYL